MVAIADNNLASGRESEERIIRKKTKSARMLY